MRCGMGDVRCRVWDNTLAIPVGARRVVPFKLSFSIDDNTRARHAVPLQNLGGYKKNFKCSGNNLI